MTDDKTLFGLPVYETDDFPEFGESPIKFGNLDDIQKAFEDLKRVFLETSKVLVDFWNSIPDKDKWEIERTERNRRRYQRRYARGAKK